MSLGKKLYCTFVDFSKAFNTITRSSLWVKLQSQILPVRFLELFTVFMTISTLALRIMINVHHFSGVILVIGNEKIVLLSFLLSI